MTALPALSHPEPDLLGREHSPDSPISVHAVTVAYQRKPVLWDVDFDIPPGVLVGLVGPNGAGKSTLLKAIMDLVPRAAGQVRVFGRPYAEQRHRVGYVPQRESVDWDFPVNVLDVVCMGLYREIGWCRRIGAAYRARALRTLEQVGMADFARRQISQLSGGQQQRVFIARALVQEADVYLLDEPFSGVDAATEQAILTLLQSLRREGKTVLVVHHDLQTVQTFFDHLMLLNMRVVAFGPMASTFTPDNLRKTYGGKLTLLDQAATAMQQLSRNG